MRKSNDRFLGNLETRKRKLGHQDMRKNTISTSLHLQFQFFGFYIHHVLHLSFPDFRFKLFPGFLIFTFPNFIFHIFGLIVSSFYVVFFLLSRLFLT